MASNSCALQGLKKGLVEQWSNTTGALEKLSTQTPSIERRCLFPSASCRFAFFKAFLLDKDMSSVEISAYYEELLASVSDFLFFRVSYPGTFNPTHPA